MQSKVFSFNVSIYSSLVFDSYEILARLIVLTLMLPTSKAVPPIELKYKHSHFFKWAWTISYT